MVVAVLVSRYGLINADKCGSSKIWRQMRSGQKK